MGKISALAFVPENDVQRYFNIATENIDQGLDVIMDYIEENYLGVLRRGRFRRPRFHMHGGASMIAFKIIYQGPTMRWKDGTIVSTNKLTVITLICGNK